MQAQKAKVEAQIEVRDKDGNLKYRGPLVMDVKHVEELPVKEKEDGNDPSDRG